MIIRTIFLLFFGLNATAQALPEIMIPSTVEVSPRENLTLFDVIEAKNMNSELEQDLKSLELVSKNAVDIFSKSDLAKMLRGIKAKFILPSSLKVLKSRSAISRMELERKIKNKIFSDCMDCEVQILVSNIPQNIESDWELDLNIDLTKKTVMIPIYNVKNPAAKGWVVAEIKQYRNLPILNRSVKFDEVLTKDMFTFEKREISNMRNTVTQIEDIERMQAARFLNAGQTLQFNDMKREQVLKKGQMVKAIFGSNSFEVIISAEAQESGSVGDVVKIKNTDSQKVFAGKIVDRGVVRIE
jgi:flagella basal body P-ring formation protein FlgA